MGKIALVNNETWAICGGRHFSDHNMFASTMSQLTDMFGVPSKIVHGGASGADEMADKWAKYLSIDVAAVNAEWDLYGKAAGPIRNEDILFKHRPQRLIAFPGGAGTADMVRRAKNRRGEVAVIEIRERPVNAENK